MLSSAPASLLPVPGITSSGRAWHTSCWQGREGAGRILPPAEPCLQHQHHRASALHLWRRRGEEEGDELVLIAEALGYGCQSCLHGSCRQRVLGGPGVWGQGWIPPTPGWCLAQGDIAGHG